MDQSTKEKKERSNTVGLSVRAERLFGRASFVFVVLLTVSWAYSILVARVTGDKVNLVTPATAAVIRAFDGDVTSSAKFVGEAVRNVVDDGPGSVVGASGKLRARIEDGDRVGIVKAVVAVAGAIKPHLVDFHFITPRPASEKRNGRIGPYFIGNWPKAKATKGGKVDYTPPSGFIEVTSNNQHTNLSEHFQLKNFLTHDQRTVWPKYVVVNLKLVDKLELILDDLQSRGINPVGVQVMSGFRTPQYNVNGGDSRGRASLSRHMYGDAADIFIDNTGNGRMSDLNGDGRVNVKDAQIIAEAAKRVEAAHPTLVGGIGIYKATSAHGPFVHIDTRGYSASW